MSPAPGLPKPKTKSVCPVCGQRQLVTHCAEESKTCGWHHCRNEKCDATLDLARRRGNAKLNGTTTRINVTLAGGAS